MVNFVTYFYTQAKTMPFIGGQTQAQRKYKQKHNASKSITQQTQADVYQTIVIHHSGLDYGSSDYRRPLLRHSQILDT